MLTLMQCTCPKVLALVQCKFSRIASISGRKLQQLIPYPNRHMGRDGDGGGRLTAVWPPPSRKGCYMGMMCEEGCMAGSYVQQAQGGIRPFFYCPLDLNSPPPPHCRYVG